jgi:hypothetical protein
MSDWADGKAREFRAVDHTGDYVLSEAQIASALRAVATATPRVWERDKTGVLRSFGLVDISPDGETCRYKDADGVIRSGPLLDL